MYVKIKQALNPVNCISGTLIISYPFILFFSIVYSIPELRVWSVLLLVVGLLFKQLVSLRKSSWILTLFVATLCLISQGWVWASYVPFLPTIIIPAFIMLLFGQSLLPGQEPIVTAIGESARGPLTPKMRKYTRRVTEFWVFIIFFLVSVSAVLFFNGWLTLWSFMASIGNYVVIVSVFIGEFCIRKSYFPDHDHPTFTEYLNIVKGAATNRGKFNG